MLTWSGSQTVLYPYNMNSFDPKIPVSQLFYKHFHFSLIIEVLKFILFTANSGCPVAQSIFWNIILILVIFHQFIPSQDDSTN